MLLFVIHCRVKTQRSFNISEVSFLLTGGGWEVCEIYILKKTWKEQHKGTCELCLQEWKANVANR